VIDGHRLTASGTMLGWRVTANAGPAGVIPFLIQWTDSAHPAEAAPVGLGLESLHIEHPDPESLELPLRALGADSSCQLELKPSTVARRRTTVSGNKTNVIPTYGANLE
jgi:hypothetical protein